MSFFSKKEKKEEEIEKIDYQKKIIEELEFLNSYLLRIAISQGELLKQQTIANAIMMLDHQYRHADGFMAVDEIQDKYLNLAAEIFADYKAERDAKIAEMQKEEQEKVEDDSGLNNSEE